MDNYFLRFFYLSLPEAKTGHTLSVSRCHCDSDKNRSLGVSINPRSTPRISLGTLYTKSGAYKNTAGRSRLSSPRNALSNSWRFWSSPVWRRLASAVSAFWLAYPAMLSPGSLRWLECQKAKRSSSRPMTSPKSSASYLRARMTFCAKSPCSNILTLTRAPAASHAARRYSAAARSSGTLAVERSNRSTVVCAVLPLPVVFWRTPSVPATHPSERSRARPAAGGAAPGGGGVFLGGGAGQGGG